MPKKRRRLLAVTSAVAAGIIALLALGSPAYAADSVRIEIRGVPRDISVGSSASVQATFANTTDQALTGVQAVVAVSLAGASPDAIRVVRQNGGELPRESSSDGNVVFVDPSPFDLQRSGGRGQVTRQYAVVFGASVPPGDATITVSAVLGGENLGSARVTTGVGIGGGRGRTTAPNTNPGFVPTFEAGPTYSLAPLPVAEQPSRVSASVPKSLYVLGVLLMLMGAASLFLIFRPPGRASARVSGAGPHRIGGPSWHPRGSSGAQASWPTVRRSGPESSWGNPPDAGPSTGSTRAVRDAGPGEALPPWLRP